MFCDPVGEEFQPYQKDAKVSTPEGSVPPVPVIPANNLAACCAIV